MITEDKEKRKGKKGKSDINKDGNEEESKRCRNEE